MLTPKLIQEITQAELFFVPQKWQEKDWSQNLCGASFDTRTLKKEQIFFCWKGEHTNGHSYLNQLQKSSTPISNYRTIFCTSRNLQTFMFLY